MGRIYRGKGENGERYYGDTPAPQPDPEPQRRTSRSRPEVIDNKCYGRLHCGQRAYPAGTEAEDAEPTEPDADDATSYSSVRAWLWRTINLPGYVKKADNYAKALNFLMRHDEQGFQKSLTELRGIDPDAWFRLMKHKGYRPFTEVDHLEDDLIALIKITRRPDRMSTYSDAIVTRVNRMRALRGYDIENSIPRSAAAKSRLGVRAAKGAAISRVMGPVLDVALEFLNPERASDMAVWETRERLEKLAGNRAGYSRNPPMDVVEGAYLEVRRLISTGDLLGAKQMMDEWERENPQTSD